jgi:hypothetical protein
VQTTILPAGNELHSRGERRFFLLHE